MSLLNQFDRQKPRTEGEWTLAATGIVVEDSSV